MKTKKPNFRIALIFLLLSIAVALISILHFFLGDYRFYADPFTFKLFTYIGLAVGVLEAVALMLFSRKGIVRFKAIADEHERLEAYVKAYNRQYIMAFFCMYLLSSCIVFSYNNSLIMVQLVLAMVLFFLFPNMYKAKHDLDLSTETMKDVFGDKYLD